MKNVGKVDKTIRVLSGMFLLSLFFFLEGNHRFWSLIGVWPIATAILGTCPAYLPFKINTCKRKEV